MRGISVLQTGKQAVFPVTRGVCAVSGKRQASWRIWTSESSDLLSKNDHPAQSFWQHPLLFPLIHRLATV